MSKAIVISGFPGIGKSHFHRLYPGRVLDSDSSLFSWVDSKETKEKVRNDAFPDNYMRHIKKNLDSADVILVSSHEEVRKALEANGIDYTLVYPAMSLKEEYLARYRKRGSDDAFVTFIGTHWPNFLSNIEKETFPHKVKLSEGQFLLDIVHDLAQKPQLTKVQGRFHIPLEDS